MENLDKTGIENSGIEIESAEPIDSRAALIDDFLSKAKNLDRDQNQVIDEKDVGWYERWGEYTDERKETYQKLMKHQNAIDPQSDVQDQVSVAAINNLRSAVPGRLARADENRKATDEAMKQFDVIDADKDGFLTDKEASASLRSGKISSQTSQFLEKNTEKLQVLSNDEWGWENNGISLKDLSTASHQDTSKDTIFIETLADELNGAPDLLTDLRTNWFDYLDLNDDKAITRQELKFHTKDSNSLLPEEHQDLVKLLYEHDDLFDFVDPIADADPLISSRDIDCLRLTVEGLDDDRPHQFQHYRHSKAYSDAVGTYVFGFGLPAGIVGAAVGAGSAGVASAGNPFLTDIGGVLGGGVGFFSGAAVGAHIGEGQMDNHFNRGYEQSRQPALESFVEKYRFLRTSTLTTP